MRYASAYEYIFSITTGEQMRVANQKLSAGQHEAALAQAKEHFLSASQLATSGLYAEAEGEFALAIILDPEFRVARYQLGLLQFTQAKITQALLTWAPLQSPQDPPTEPDALVCFTNGFRALSENDVLGAKSLFEAGLARGFDNQPLLEDIRKLLSALNALEGNVFSDNPVKLPPSETIETSKEGHILLSGYAQ